MLSKFKKEKMRNIINIILLLIVTQSYSQELNVPIFTQQLADNPFVVSPTYAGIGDNVRIRVNGLSQWVGIKNAPQNQSVYADMRIADRSGVGISLYNDKNGFTRQAGAKFSFAQHIILDYYSNQFLSFGLSYNYNNFRIETEQFDQTIFDKSIVNNRFNANNNFDLGFLYRNKAFYTAFNISNLLNKSIRDFQGIEPNLLRNYQIYSGYIFQSDLTEGLEIEPSVFYQFYQSDKRSTTDFNIKVRKKDPDENYYWAGLSARFLNDQSLKPIMIGPMAGMKQKNFYFGYSYLVTINELSGFNSGTHILTLGMDIFQGLSNCPCTQYLSRD